ncbi:MAG: hypothetical protein JWL76_1157 [Thermoleophilia bacterium]|nr:hypothetical protein [Thermoleophilia bacterium]
MQLDASRIRQAAQELGVALQHADAAAAIDVPAIFGRGGAKATIASELRDVVRHANAAGEQLAQLDGPIADARRATDLLAGESTLAMGSIHRLRGTAFQPALEGARTLHAELTRIGDALGAPASELPDLLQSMSRQSHGQARDWRAINTVAARRIDELGAPGPYLAEMTNDGHRLQMVDDAVSDHPDGLMKAWANLTTTATRAPVRADSLRRAFADMASTTSGPIQPTLPAWLADAAPGAWVRPTLDQAHELRLLARAGSREDVAAQVLEVLSSPNLDRGDLQVLGAAARLGDDLAVEVPLLPDQPSLQAMIDVDTSGLYIHHKELLHDAYVRLATSSDAIVERESARLSRGVPTVHHVRLLARLGVEKPQSVLGVAGSQPWATQLLSKGLDPKMRFGEAHALVDTFELVRRTGGDRGKLLDEFERLAQHVSPNEPDELAPIGHALRMLPDELRPRGAAVIQDRLDAVFHGGGRHPDRTRQADSWLGDSVSVLVEGERLAANPATTRASIVAEYDELLARPLDGFDDSAVRRLAVLSTLPEELRPNLGGYGVLRSRVERHAGVPRTAIDWMRILREGEQLAALPGTTKASTTAELRRLLEIAPEVRTRADVRRMLMLRHAPAQVSPIAGRAPDLSKHGLESVADIGVWNSSRGEWAGMSHNANMELEQLRLAVDRSETVLAGATPDSVQTELRALLGAPNSGLDAEQLRRIAVLDGLPTEVRGYEPVTLPEGGVAAKWQPELVAAKLRTDLGMLRLSLEATADAARNSYTRTNLTHELGTLLSRDNDQLTPAQQQRVATIASMPPDVRPELPERISNHYGIDRKTLPEIHVEDLWRAGYGRSAADAAREAILPNGGLTIDELVAMVRQGDGSIRIGGLAPSARRLITTASTAELERIGITPVSLARDILEATRDSGSQIAVSQAVRDAYPVAAHIEVGSDGERQVLERLRLNLQRNLDRIDGRLHDGYSNHPDYAEHGRAIEDAVLLGRIGDLRRSRAAATSATSDAAAGESLTW